MIATSEIATIVTIIIGFVAFLILQTRDKYNGDKQKLPQLAAASETDWLTEL